MQAACDGTAARQAGCPLPPPSTSVAATATPTAAPTPVPTSGQPAEDSRKHVAFAEQLVDFEKSQVNALWRCLFGKDGDGRRFASAEQLSMALEAALYADPVGFPPLGRAWERTINASTLIRQTLASKRIPAGSRAGGTP